MPKGVLFLTLNVFSVTGGIEKVSKILGKALNELVPNVHVYSMHDIEKDVNDTYFPSSQYKAFSGNKARFLKHSIMQGRKQKIVFLSHVNLLIAGYFIKLLSPSVKVVLLAHGIEVWKKFPGWKANMLKSCNLILAVSNYTKETMLTLNPTLESSKMMVLNNCLDPLLTKHISQNINDELRTRYNLNGAHKVMITLSRLAFSEQYKGYDKVIMAMKEINRPELRYLLVGKYDETEKARLDQLISSLGVEGKIIFTGFIPDSEVAGHLSLGDVFVMPSTNEGFGISFIEAMYYGTPVIAGNMDGSVDALLNGKLGTLVDPGNVRELAKAITNVIDGKDSHVPDKNLLLSHFEYEKYKESVMSIIQFLDKSVLVEEELSV